MKVLIIGSKGFIGSNLFNYFKQKSFTTVAGCDVQDVENDHFYFCFGREENGFDSLFQKNSFDCCINCSGAANVPESLKNPMQDFELNTLNVFKMLEAIRLHQPCCKFLNISSAAVYGNPKKLPVSEQDELAPVSPYGLHKMQAEQLCKSFFDYWQIPTCSLRIFSAYGPGLKKQLFWDLYQKSLNTSNVELFGTGAETRDFIFIDDIVQAIQLVIETVPFRGECINIANGVQSTTKEAVGLFYEALCWKGNVSFKGEVRKGDPLNWEADITKLKTLGYKMEFDLKKGLVAYAKWIKELS